MKFFWKEVIFLVLIVRNNMTAKFGHTPQNRTAFKYWFGLYCTNCGEIIPCLGNGLSFLILVIAFPIEAIFTGYAI